MKDISMNISSVSDIVFDIFLFMEYIQGSSVKNNDSFGDDYFSPLFGNVTCELYNLTSDGKDVMCVKYVKYDHWFSILTLFFIYLPSVNVIATLYGPETAGKVGMRMSLVMAFVGGIFAIVGYFVSSPATSMIGWFVIILGSGILGISLLHLGNGGDGECLHYFMFIPLVIFSPVIFIIIKFLAILKSGNTLLKSQSTWGTRGEVILEAAPQLGLQLYIVMLTLNPRKSQVLSILTSAATLSLPNIENFVVARGGDFGFKSAVKNILVFIPASLFKILSVSLLGLFLRGWLILIIVVIIVLLYATVLITFRYYNLPRKVDDAQQAGECLLAWLTLVGLGKRKSAALFRLFSTLLITIIYSLILVIIMIICNVNPNSGYVYGAVLAWSDLKIVQDRFYLNLLLGSTIGLGWVSFLLDIIITWCKSHDWRSHNWGCMEKLVNWFVDPKDKDAGFWDEAVLLQGLGFKTNFGV